MSDSNTQFIRKYKRQSKSIWEDDASTLLLYADVEQIKDKRLTLNFTRYVYLHRDDVGKVLGISVSNKMLEETPEFDSRYLEDIEMYGFLLMHLDIITEFCCLFSDEFERIFLLEPRDYFEAAELRWFSILRDV